MSPLLFSAVAIAADVPFATPGCAQLEQLSEIRFTFNVETSGELKLSRTWVFRPRTSEVVRTVDGESLSFRFGSPRGETETQADAQFVNDSFWLLPYCHMAWATDLDISEVSEGTLPVAPVGEAPGRAPMVTVRYPAQGGYTPGDAYDLFLNPQGDIVAWNYRRRAGDKPTMSTTFDGYVQVGPFRISTEHKSSDPDFRLFISDIAVEP